MFVTYEEVKNIFSYDACEPSGKAAIAIFYHPQKTVNQLAQIVQDVPFSMLEGAVNDMKNAKIIVEIPRHVDGHPATTYGLSKMHRENFEELLSLELERRR